MLKKFALDPELFADFPHFRALRDKFGVTQGRLIAKFPSKWKALVREACKRALEEARLKPARAITIMNWMAAARACGSRGGTSRPLTPCLTTSRQPGASVVTIGSPHAAASSKLRGTPSR